MGWGGGGGGREAGGKSIFYFRFNGLKLLFYSKLSSNVLGELSPSTQILAYNPSVRCH